MCTRVTEHQLPILTLVTSCEAVSVIVAMAMDTLDIPAEADHQDEENKILMGPTIFLDDAKIIPRIGQDSGLSSLEEGLKLDDQSQVNDYCV